MKKLIKVVATLIVVIVALVIAGAVLLSIFIDPNDYKGKIEQIALDKAGVELKIDGDIDWSFYPSVGLEISKVEAAFAQKAPLASLSRAKVSVLLMPLFSGDVQMKAVTIQGLNLNLVKTSASNNWQAETQEPKQKSLPETSDSKSDLAKKLKIDIESIAIEDAQITYSDETTGQITRIKNFNATTDRIILDKPFNATLDFNAQIESKGKTTLDSNVNLSANFELTPAAGRYKISKLISKVNINSGTKIDLTLQGDIDANLTENTLNINNLMFSIFNLKATGAAKITGADFNQISASIGVPAFDLKALMQKLNLPAVSTHNDKSLRSIAFMTQIKGSSTSLNFNQLAIALDSTKITGDAKYQINDGAITFNLKGDSVNISDYLPTSANTSNSQSTTQKAPNTGSSKSSLYSKDVIIPLQPLRDLNLKGQLGFSKLTYQQTIINNFITKINAKGGLIKIPTLNLSLYKGTIKNSITIDARKKTLSMNITNDITKLQLGPILKNYADTDVLSGSLTTKSKLTAYGQSVHSVVNSLTGKINFTLANGLIKGIDAAQEMCETVNKISSLGGAVSKTEAVDKSTPFASINGTFNIKKGIVSNNNFKADLDAFNATGKGIVNLPIQAIDYRVGLKIQDNLFKKSCSVNNKIQGIEWPVDCKGKFSDDPLKLCKPDLSVIKDLVKNLLKAELEKKLGISLEAKKKELKAKAEAKKAELKAKVKEKIEEQKKQVEDKLKNKLEGALKGLF